MKTKIGIFDSGIGGLTVLKECIKENPNYEYIYYSDSIHNPYGEKTKEEIKTISDNITAYLISKNCKIIIIACNTASLTSVDYLRNKYPNIIFLAIEPALKVAYLSIKDNENCLIMATPATINSEKFKKLYNEYNKNNFYKLPCEGLAHLIETENKQKIKEYLILHLSPYKNKVSNVVLGCTHYPIIKQEIIEVLGDITFYDGAQGLAKHLKQILKDNKIEKDNITKITLIDSGKNKNKLNKIWEAIYE